jgi:hypothetical protein
MLRERCYAVILAILIVWTFDWDIHYVAAAMRQNRAPVATDRNLSTPEDTAINIKLTAADKDRDPLTYSVLSFPGHGVLSGTPPDLIYRPFPNYSGPDAFTFKVNDGNVDSNTATIGITVTPVNDAPVVFNQSVATRENTAVSITLSGADADENDAL